MTRACTLLPLLLVVMVSPLLPHSLVDKSHAYGCRRVDFIGLSAHADSGTRTTKERRAARLSPRLRHPGNRGPSRPRVTRIQRVHLALRAAGAEPCRWPSPSPSRLPPRPCVTVTVLPRTATDAIARTEEARSIGRRIRRPGHGTNAPPISTLNRRFVDADRQQRQHAHRVPAARSGPPSPQTPASPFPSLPPASPGPPGASSSGLERGPVPSGRSSGRLHPPPGPPRGQRRPAAATTFCGRGRVPVMSGAILGTRPPAPSSAVGRRGTPQVNRIPPYPTQGESGRRNTGAAAGRALQDRCSGASERIVRDLGSTGC